MLRSFFNGLAVHAESNPVWTVFFMKKLVRNTVFCLVLAGTVWCASVFAQRELLNEELIRLHVVANSDSREDQDIKLLVRDAVLESLEEDLANTANAEEAKAYLEENLPKLQALVTETLEKAGFYGGAVVSLCKERFDTRYYDTFTLPAGVYEALRITIGQGAGHNWWCVAFPTLCMPDTTQGFSQAAAGAGFPEPLTGALRGESEYQVRFYLLDLLGRWENRLFP